MFFRFLAALNFRNSVLLVVLFIGIVYSAIQIAKVGKDQGRPLYQNTPSAAFSSAVSDTLISSAILDRPRLPDADYTDLSQRSDTLNRTVLRGDLKLQDLVDQGLSTPDARTTRLGLQSFADSVFGRTVTELPLPSMTVASPKSVEFSSLLTLSNDASVGPPLRSRATQTYVRKDGKWLLASMTMDLLDTIQ